MVYFDQSSLAYTFKHCLETGLQNHDESSSSISPASRDQFVKMLITLEPQGIVLPAKSDSYVMFCLQSYLGLRIDISLVY